jgi:predicted small secreted protein
MNSYTVKNYLWVVIVLMFIAIALLSGCSTVDGMGKDISSTAQWTKEKMGGSK